MGCCLRCGREIVNGASEQDFCSLACCRRYHASRSPKVERLVSSNLMWYLEPARGR